MSFISLVIPATERESVSASVASAINSYDPDWEVVILLSQSDSGNRHLFEHLLTQDNRIRLLECSENIPNSPALNQLLHDVRGEFVLMMQPGDRLGRDAIGSLRNAESESSADLIYGDENLFSPGGEFLVRHNKSAWSPERLRSHFYLGHFLALRTSAARRSVDLGELLESDPWYDLTLRVSESAQQIAHIAKAVFDSIVAEDELGRFPGQVRAPEIDPQVLENHLSRVGLKNRAEQIRQLRTKSAGARTENELVSVVIPTKGTVRRVWGHNAVLIEQCVAALLQFSTHDPLEITVIADTDTSPDVLERVDESSRVKVVEYDRTFNYSETINIGSRYANSDLMLCMDDDVIPLDPNWIENLAYFFEELDVGVVGPTLLNEDFTIQSAGKFFHRGHRDAGWARSNELLASNDKFSFPAERTAVGFSAVMLRLSLFEQFGGLDVDIPTSGAGLDYCNKVISSNNRIIWTPHSRVVHLKESSRPQSISETDSHRLNSRWGSRLRGTDPYLRLVDLELSGLTVYDRYEAWIDQNQFLEDVKQPDLQSNFTVAPVHPKLSQNAPSRNS